MRSIKGMLLRATAAAGLASLALASLLVAGHQFSGDPTIALAGKSTTPPASANDPWTIASDGVTGLAPRASRSLRLQVTNPYAFDISVQRIDVSLTPGASTGRSGCLNTTANLVPSPPSPGLGQPFVVKAGATVTAPYVWTLSMPATASTTCQGATFDLTYTGDATKAAGK